MASDDSLPLFLRINYYKYYFVLSYVKFNEYIYKHRSFISGTALFQDIYYDCKLKFVHRKLNVAFLEPRNLPIMRSTNF